MTADQEPLDATQVRTIGRVQHGFLFQHVLAARFAAQELLTPGFLAQIIVEHDEDIEIVGAIGRLYIQVKAYQDLVFSQLADSLLRMHAIRFAHLAEERTGTCQLYFAIGGNLGEELKGRNGKSKRQLEAKVRELAKGHSLDADALVETWGSIGWLLPEVPHPDFPAICFRAGANELLRDLTNELGKVPRLANAPSSAAYALAASMHALAADSLVGFADRRLSANEVAQLVGTIEQQVQRLPDLPSPHVPLPVTRDHFVLGETTALIGSSGSGKSTYLAFEALQRALSVLYLLPTESGVAGVRECALQLRQHLVDSGVDPSRLIAPSADVPVAEMVDSLCENLPPNTFVVVDDAHLFVDSRPAQALLRGIAARAPNGLVLCGLPQGESGHATSSTLAALLGRTIETADVPGWTKGNIAELLFLKGMSREPVVSANLANISGGHPFAVQALIDLASRQFEGNIDHAIAAVERGTVEVTHSAIVSAHFASLPASARHVAAVVALTKLAPEAAALGKLMPVEEVTSGLQALLAHRCLVRTPQGLRLHALYAHTAEVAAPDTIPREERLRIHTRAAAMLGDEVQRTRRADLIPIWLLNLGLAGSMVEVVEILTDGGDLWVEALQRIGIGTPIAQTIQTLIPHAGPQETFWLYDCLIFLNVEEDLRLDKDQLWRSYSESFAALDDQDEAEPTYLTKAMIRAKDNRDAGTLDALWIQVQKLTVSLERKSILNSVYANCLYQLGDYEDAWAIGVSVMNFQMMILRLSEKELWTSEPNDLLRLLNGSDRAAISRLGDALLHVGMCLRDLGEWPADIFARSKFFYDAIGAAKAFYKAELHMARQLGRVRAYRPSAIKLMEERLSEFKRIGFDGGTVVTTCTLVALHESAGHAARANELLVELAHFDQAEVREELDEARSQVQPYTAELPGPLTKGLMRLA